MKLIYLYQKVKISIRGRDYMKAAVAKTIMWLPEGN